MTKECVACAEQILENAKLCRYCKTDQQNSVYSPTSGESEKSDIQQNVLTGHRAASRTLGTCRMCHEEKELLLKHGACYECFDASEFARPSHSNVIPRKAAPKARASSTKLIAVLLALVASGSLWWATTNGMFSSADQQSNRNNSNSSVPSQSGTDADFSLEEGSESAPNGYYKDVCQWVTTQSGGDAYGMNGNGQVSTVKVRECRQVWVED